MAKKTLLSLLLSTIFPLHRISLCLGCSTHHLSFHSLLVVVFQQSIVDTSPLLTGALYTRMTSGFLNQYFPLECSSPHNFLQNMYLSMYYMLGFFSNFFRSFQILFSRVFIFFLNEGKRSIHYSAASQGACGVALSSSRMND